MGPGNQGLYVNSLNKWIHLTYSICIVIWDSYAEEWNLAAIINVRNQFCKYYVRKKKRIFGTVAFYMPHRSNDLI